MQSYFATNFLPKTVSSSSCEGSVPIENVIQTSSVQVARQVLEEPKNESNFVIEKISKFNRKTLLKTARLIHELAWSRTPLEEISKKEKKEYEKLNETGKARLIAHLTVSLLTTTPGLERNEIQAIQQVFVERIKDYLKVLNKHSSDRSAADLCCLLDDISNSDKTVFSKLSQIIQQNCTLKVEQLVDTLFAFRKISVSDSDFLPFLANLLGDTTHKTAAERLTPSQIAKMMEGCRIHKYKGIKFFENMSFLIASQLKEFDANDVYFTLRAYADKSWHRLNITDVEDKQELVKIRDFVIRVRDALKTTVIEKSQQFDEEELFRVVYLLFSCGVKDQALSEILYQRLLKDFNKLTAQEITDITKIILDSEINDEGKLDLLLILICARDDFNYKNLIKISYSLLNYHEQSNGVERFLSFTLTKIKDCYSVLKENQKWSKQDLSQLHVIRLFYRLKTKQKWGLPEELEKLADQYVQEDVKNRFKKNNTTQKALMKCLQSVNSSFEEEKDYEGYVLDCVDEKQKQVIEFIGVNELIPYNEDHVNTKTKIKKRVLEMAGYQVIYIFYKDWSKLRIKDKSLSEKRSMDQGIHFIQQKLGLKN